MALPALPPHLPAGAAGHHLRRQRTVEGGVPLPGHLRLHSSQIVEAGQYLPPGTVWTAAAALDPGRHNALIGMAQGAQPPDLPVGAGRHLPRGQRFIFGWVPLGRNGRKQAGQIVFSGLHLPPGADRTAAARNPGGHAGLPFVTLFADPPDLAGGTRRDLVRGKRPIFRGVPLGGKPGILTGQIVFRGAYFPVGAHGTAAACHTGIDLCPPLMSALADPPGHLMTAGQYLCWSEITVSRWMPLAGQLRKERGQVVLSRLWHLACTDRAAGSAAGPGMYRGLPVMAFSALPPDLFLAAVGDDGRCDRQIFVRRPLIQQLLPPFLYAEVVQAFTHGQSPFYAESTFCRFKAIAGRSL